MRVQNEKNFKPTVSENQFKSCYGIYKRQLAATQKRFDRTISKEIVRQKKKLIKEWQRDIPYMTAYEKSLDFSTWRNYVDTILSQDFNRFNILVTVPAKSNGYKFSFDFNSRFYSIYRQRKSRPEVVNLKFTAENPQLKKVEQICLLDFTKNRIQYFGGDAGVFSYVTFNRFSRIALVTFTKNGDMLYCPVSETAQLKDTPTEQILHFKSVSPGLNNFQLIENILLTE
ncbi:MAG: hypothetical protein D4R43_01325 [Sphingobacteriales bacterium]|nr:MAG: hypothetical protein D4R43_01325 [Sphingobacteriales bacterium]